jgi:hypothetical protein
VSYYVKPTMVSIPEKGFAEMVFVRSPLFKSFKPFNSLQPFKSLKPFDCLSPEFWILTSGSLLHALCLSKSAVRNQKSEIPKCLVKILLWLNYFRDPSVD